jgi:predicted AAA+ superfamily ATPase
MDLLENIFDNTPHIPETVTRKIQISHKKTFIFGPRFCGKTFLIYDYINTNKIKDFLYIDLRDYKNKTLSFEYFEQFISVHNIELLIIENFDNSFKLPLFDNIIVTSDDYLQLEGFHTIHLMPLDFEEYIAFDSKHQSITISFNNFLKYGNLPDIVEYKEYRKTNRNNELLTLITNHPTKKAIILTLIKAIGQTHSPYHLYSQLKKEIKISKDLFYSTLSEFEANHTLLLCPKYNHEKASKKIFFYNYSFIDNVTYKKNFAHIFANMIYLELFNKSYEIYYLDGIDFFIPEINSFIIAMPFFNQLFFDNISKKIIKASHHINIEYITIVTISNDSSFYLEDIEVKVIPFYEWALGD